MTMYKKNTILLGIVMLGFVPQRQPTRKIDNKWGDKKKCQVGEVYVTDQQG